MPIDEDSKAEIAIGLTNAATAAGAAAATGNGAFAVVIASAAVGVSSVLTRAVRWVRERDARNAEAMFAQMAREDPDPAGFERLLTEKIEAGDDEMLIRVRALLTASLEAAAPSALPVIATIGRAFLRGECAPWVARGWLRLLADVSDSELEPLRALAFATRASLVNGEERRAQVAHQAPVDSVPYGVVILLSPPRASVNGYQSPRDPPCLCVWPAPEGPGQGIDPVSTWHGARLLELLAHHGVASTRATMVESWRKRAFAPDDRPAVQMTHESATGLALAFRA